MGLLMKLTNAETQAVEYIDITKIARASHVKDASVVGKSGAVEIKKGYTELHVSGCEPVKVTEQVEYIIQTTEAYSGGLKMVK